MNSNTYNDPHSTSAARMLKVSTLIARAAEYMKSQRYADAESLFQEAYRLMPDLPTSLVGLAQVAQMQGKWDLALHYWQECAQRFPHHRQPEWVTATGIVLVHLRRFGEAEDLFSDLLSNHPGSPAAYIGLAKLAFAQRHWDLALERWTQCIHKFQYALEPDWLAEKGKALIKLERFAEAKELFQQLYADHPDFQAGQIGLAKIAEITGHLDQALSHWDTCIAISPKENRAEWISAKADLLVTLGKLEKAEKLLIDLTHSSPDKPAGLLGLANLAAYRENLVEAARYWSKILDLFPLDSNIKSHYIDYLDQSGKYEEAQQLCIEEIENGDIQYSLKLCDSLRLQYRIPEALQIARKLAHEYPHDLDIRLMEIQILLEEWTASHIQEALEMLLELFERFPESLRVIVWLLRSLVRNGNYLQAEDLLQNLPEEIQSSARMAEFRSWYLLRNSNAAEARSIMSASYQNRYLASLHATCHLRRLDENIITDDRSEILLFCPIKNELLTLPWFLRYYRHLGVNRFIFIDNNSSDGSTDFLLSQNDVHLYWTDDNFYAASSGMRWINELISIHGKDKWCLFTDSDEAFVFPRIEQQKIQHLIEYLERKGHEAMFSFMLDMYPSVLPTQTGYQRDQDILQYSPFFDNSYQFFDHTFCPYRTVKGGVRERLFGTYEILEKIPLTKGGLGISYLNNHASFPARISDVTGVLLHFNLLLNASPILSSSDDSHEAASELRSGECNYRYRKYNDVIRNMKEFSSLLSDHSTKYSGSSQLIELDLIHRPDDY